MGLLGESWDDPKSQGLLALASGMLQGNMGAGVANFGQVMANAPDVAMKRKLMTEELAMKQLAEKRAQASFEQNQALYKMFQGGDAPVAGAQPGQSVTGQATGDPGMVAGIPRNAALADLALNGGKNVPEWMYKQGIPDMQVSNGVAYDKNKIKGGFLPGMSVSQNGQASLTTIGPDGLPRVSAPEGALDTASAYKRAEAGLKPIKVFNPDTQREEFSNEAEVAAPRLSRGETGMRSQAAGPMGADPAALRREIAATTADLKKTLDPSSRAALKDHLDGLTTTLASIPASGRVAAGPSAMEAAQNEAAKTGLVDTAKANVVRDTTRLGDAKRYGQLTATADRALTLLESGPTASGIGSAIDSAANFFGKSMKGADAAAELSTLAGWMTANVPRMEGPQSDKDVAQYRIMAGAVGDKTVPISQRIAAAKELKLLQDKYADLNGYAAQTGGASGDFSAPKPARSASMADIAATAKASGKTTAEVTKALKAQGYTIGGM